MVSTRKGNSLHATTASVGHKMLSPHRPSAATGIPRSDAQSCSPPQLVALGYCKQGAMNINFPPTPKPSRHTQGGKKAPEGNDSSPKSLPAPSSRDVRRVERPLRSAPSRPAELQRPEAPAHSQHAGINVGPARHLHAEILCPLGAFSSPYVCIKWSVRDLLVLFKL